MKIDVTVRDLQTENAQHALNDACDMFKSLLRPEVSCRIVSTKAHSVLVEGRYFYTANLSALIGAPDEVSRDFRTHVKNRPVAVPEQ